MVGAAGDPKLRASLVIRFSRQRLVGLEFHHLTTIVMLILYTITSVIQNDNTKFTKEENLLWLKSETIVEVLLAF